MNPFNLNWIDSIKAGLQKLYRSATTPESFNSTNNSNYPITESLNPEPTTGITTSPTILDTIGNMLIT
jgi:hypothetical protein